MQRVLTPAEQEQLMAANQWSTDRATRMRRQAIVYRLNSPQNRSVLADDLDAGADAIDATKRTLPPDPLEFLGITRPFTEDQRTGIRKVLASIDEWVRAGLVQVPPPETAVLLRALQQGLDDSPAPRGVIEAARFVETYFAEQNIRHWKLGGLQSRD